MAVLILLASTLCAGCECKWHIDNGNFKNLRIGMSKDAVLVALKESGVKSIEPVVGKLMQVNYLNIEKIGELSPALGICLKLKKGGEIQISLLRDDMEIIYVSPTLRDVADSLEQVATRKKLFSVIRQNMVSNHGLSAVNCIVGVKNIELTKDTGKMYSMRYFNHWFFYVPNSYSTATLNFKDNRLESVDYIYRRYETP